MSTTGPTSAELDKPFVGQPILVAFFDGSHTIHRSVAHVLSIGPVDADTNKPTISVAYPNPDADLTILSSASWFKAYTRQTGVQHISHPAVQAGQLSIAYGHSVPVDEANQPDIPQPAGDGTNPIFTRDDDPVITKVSIGQAAIVQGAKVPGPTVQSPLINEEVEKVSPAEPAPEFTAITPSLHEMGNAFVAGVGDAVTQISAPLATPAPVEPAADTTSAEV